MAANQLGTGHINALAGASLTCAALAGYISPNIQTLRVTHTATRDEIIGQAGITTGLILQNDAIECSFDIIPEGSTIANAKKSCGLPTAGRPYTISGLPVIAMGPFPDAFNDVGVSPWIYEGGGQINGDAKGKWTATVVMRRYPGITSGNLVV